MGNMTRNWTRKLWSVDLVNFKSIYGITGKGICKVFRAAATYHNLFTKLTFFHGNQHIQAIFSLDAWIIK